MAKLNASLDRDPNEPAEYIVGTFTETCILVKSAGLRGTNTTLLWCLLDLLRRLNK